MSRTPKRATCPCGARVVIDRQLAAGVVALCGACSGRSERIRTTTLDILPSYRSPARRDPPGPLPLTTVKNHAQTFPQLHRREDAYYSCVRCRAPCHTPNTFVCADCEAATIAAIRALRTPPSVPFVHEDRDAAGDIHRGNSEMD